MSDRGRWSTQNIRLEPEVVVFKSSLCQTFHDDVIKWTHFRVTGHLCGEFTGQRRLKLPASRLLNQPFVQVQIKENIQSPRHWPLWAEFPWAQKAINAENAPIWWRHHDKFPLNGMLQTHYFLFGVLYVYRIHTFLLINAIGCLNIRHEWQRGA